MSFKGDKICKGILKDLLSGPKDFADLRRATGVGSQETIKKHVEKHLKPELVRVREVPKGARTYFLVELTEKGKSVALKLKGET